MARPAPGTRADYAWFTEQGLRFADNDLYGHLNNAVHYVLFDTAVSEWQYAHDMFHDGGDWRDLVVESGCRYHAEARHPDRVHAGLRLGHAGRSSWRYDIGLFRNDEQAAFAEGFFAMVLVDATTHRPAPMPDEMRAALERLQVGAG